VVGLAAVPTMYELNFTPEEFVFSAYPVRVHALYKWFPDAKRALPTVVVLEYAATGGIIAPTLGLISFLWGCCMVLCRTRGALDDPADPCGPVKSFPYRRLLLTPTFLGCCLACFGAYWAISLSLTSLTPFIVDGLGYSQATAAVARQPALGRGPVNGLRDRRL
jgi:hypothetical protein